MRLAVFGSRTLKDNRVEALIYDELEKSGAEVIVTSQEPLGVCTVAQQVAKKTGLVLGLAEVPVYVALDMSDEQVKAFRLADNRVAEIATWDKALLAEEIKKITGIDLEEFGFDKSMLDDVHMDKLGVKYHTCPKCGHTWEGK